MTIGDVGPPNTGVKALATALGAVLDAHPEATGLLLGNEAAAVALPSVLGAGTAGTARPVGHRALLRRLRPVVRVAVLVGRERLPR